MRSLAELYAKYKGPVYGYLYRMCGQSAEAEELTQETFYQAVLSLHRFRGEAAVLTWLLKIARNVYLKAQRPASRERIAKHLEGCAVCRDYLRQLRSPLPPLPPLPDGASADARFLLRLKRNAGTALGLALVLVVLAILAPRQVQEWRRDREFRRQQAAERVEQHAAYDTLAALTPDPVAALERYGISVGLAASRDQSLLRIDYQVNTRPGGPVAHVGPAHGPAPGPQLLDPATGEVIYLPGGGGGSQWGQGGGQGKVEYGLAGDPPKSALFQFPMLLAYLNADQPWTFDFERPAGDGEVRIDQEVTVQGVAFHIQRLSWQSDTMRVHYRQLTDPRQMGVHYLYLELEDRLGTTYGDRQVAVVSPEAPYQEFGPLRTVSQHFRLRMEHAVLAVPGPRIPLEIK